jgi:peptidoglycan/LPS O-acetylase OafA/YrhL
VLKEFGLASGISGLALFLLLTALLSETSFRLLEAPMRRLIRGPGRA